MKNLLNINRKGCYRQNVDENNKSAEVYPLNPADQKGVAATRWCGRHLAVMPHPERCF